MKKKIITKTMKLRKKPEVVEEKEVRAENGVQDV